MKLASHSAIALLVCSCGVLAAMTIGRTAEPLVAPQGSPPALRAQDVPEPSNLQQFVADKQAAIQLGKAWFWDIQVGSDGMTACATCHYHAGADSRSINQMNPGKDGQWHIGPNTHLDASHFPLRTLSNPNDRTSPPTTDNNDIVASQGVFNMEFERNIAGLPFEIVKRPFDPVFSVGGLNVRRVEPRNTPTVINAVFNYRNFWDGRAQNEFNGVDNWGERNPDARVYRASSSSAMPVPVRLLDPANPQYRLINSSLASQAVAPILSPDEMSASGRDATDIANKIIKHRGKKLSLTRPLGFQRVDPEDSVLGSMSRWPLPGLSAENYEALIRKAFRKEWWDSKHALKVADDGSVRVLQNRKPSRDDEYTLMEYNFGLFFGIALQLYQATLVSDDTPYDRWRRGDPGATISEQALLGLQVFVSQDRDIRDGDGNIIQRIRGGRCVNCHSGAELTDASVTAVKAGTVRRNRNHVDSNGITLDVQDLDRGFNNIGVRPTTEDLGVGGVDKFGKPLSAVALCRQHPAQPQPPAPCPPTGTAYLAVEGAFKAPGLRNVELTAPYFHNGGHLTLESVIEFYSRGGDLGPVLATDGTREIAPLSIPSLDGAHVGLTQAERDALVAFLKTLTDERVRNRKAPFDHPDLFIPHGQLDDNLTARRDPLRPGQAMDRVRLIQAVGRSGGAPLPQFLQLQ